MTPMRSINGPMPELGDCTQRRFGALVSSSDAASYACVVTDYCLPAANRTSASASLTVTSGQSAGVVANLRLQKVNGGVSLKLTWNNTTNATDYVVFEDTSPKGAFSTQTGTSTSGVTGLTIPKPSINKFYLVAGRNSTCGVGPEE